MIAVGVGFRSEVTADEIEAVVRLALAQFGVAGRRIDVVATESAKAAMPAVCEAAQRFSAELVACSLEQLDGVAGRVLTHSEQALKAKGVSSIAESSALVAAGRNGRLLGARVASARATCAIAVGDGP